jgi:AcrR family transcriptional regulator
VSSERTAAPRPYRKRERAERERRTRDRIAAAAVELHGTIGPRATTVKAIAERAGVERATVYRHFPNDEALFDACTAHFYGRHPLPDAEQWLTTQSPATRLRRALDELYGWYEQNESMIANVTRDAAFTPAGARGRFRAYFEGAHAILMTGRTERGRARVRTSAAIGHAISFPTWRSLAREQKLRRTEVIELMVALAAE